MSTERWWIKLWYIYTIFSSVQLLSRPTVTPWTAAHQTCLSNTNCWSLPKPMSIESVMPSNLLVIPFSSCPQSFPEAGSFQMSQLFALGGQSIGVSASVQFSSVQFRHSVISDSLRPHELQHARPPCPSPTPRVRSNSCPSSWWCHPAISSCVIPFSSLPSIPPRIRVFPNESPLRIR